MIEDARVPVLVTDAHARARLTADGVAVICLDDEDARRSAANLPPISTPADLAYVIYTSDPRASPKGWPFRIEPSSTS